MLGKAHREVKYMRGEVHARWSKYTATRHSEASLQLRFWKEGFAELTERQQDFEGGKSVKVVGRAVHQGGNTGKRAVWGGGWPGRSPWEAGAGVEPPGESCECPTQRPQVASMGSLPPRPRAEMRGDARTVTEPEPEGGGVSKEEGLAVEVRAGPIMWEGREPRGRHACERRTWKKIERSLK